MLDSIATWEVEQEQRVIEKTRHFTIVCPYASRFAFQTWIIPTELGTCFEDAAGEVIEELGMLIFRHVGRLESILVEPAYNVLFHMPPFKASDSNPWFVEIIPRLTTAAGFELGTDIWINPVSPETASRRFRQAKPD